VAQIEYRLEIGEKLTLKIFNRSGQLVKTIVDERPSATGIMTWDGTNDNGGPVRPGPYVLLARSDPRGDAVKKVIVVGP
jgi:flagellar hook assembly protein FlgD